MKYRPPGRETEYRPRPVPCRRRGHRLSAGCRAALRRWNPVLPPQALHDPSSYAPPAAPVGNAATPTHRRWRVCGLSMLTAEGGLAAPARSRPQVKPPPSPLLSQERFQETPSTCRFTLRCGELAEPACTAQKSRGCMLIRQDKPQVSFAPFVLLQNLNRSAVNRRVFSSMDDGRRRGGGLRWASRRRPAICQCRDESPGWPATCRRAAGCGPWS